MNAPSSTIPVALAREWLATPGYAQREGGKPWTNGLAESDELWRPGATALMAATLGDYIGSGIDPTGVAGFDIAEAAAGGGHRPHGIVLAKLGELRCALVKSLIALGWLRDIVLVLLFCAGNHLRHTVPTIGITIMAGTLIIFAERFVWSWHLCDLREKNASSSDHSSS